MPRRRRALKRTLAWAMLVGSATGIALTGAGVIGGSEPQLVLQLSWAALLFSAVDALFIADEED